MNKTDRMLAIVLELQRKDVVRAEDLAAAFETSVRTIYRDIQALSEAGVPVIGATGQGYSLVKGYFLPPVSFTAEEAVTLLIGTDFIEQRFDAHYGTQASAAGRKIEAILPEDVRGSASRIRKSIRLLTPGKEITQGTEQVYIEQIRRAILEERKISFGYWKFRHEADGSHRSVRTVRPYGLVLNRGAWTLVAYCELRQEIRHFRLSRMSELTVLDDRFQAPADFDLHEYQPEDDRHVHVRILVQPEIAGKAAESGNFYLEAMEDQADGRLMTFRVRQPEDLLQWVLGWGADAVVLEPEALRNRVRDEAARMFSRY
ncbi:YafY family transcriptional regulator [Paenibacillus tritici]|uniref:helix-turn-helix transcriptional regulator n=1 Tax=Paenibacillus tritici TaxID=1873425 RepID=UPI001BA8C675|nr:YafY family protein [Paenibacillus tritici]QUL54849.1 YafY family transcriptional regulator [Paenibacillus tritici]